MTALPYYHVAARAVPAITATPCGGYPPERRLTDTLRWYARFRRGSWPLKDGGRLGAVLTPGRATTAACGRSASGSALIERWPW